MITVRKYIKIAFYAAILFLVIKSGFVIYYKFFHQNITAQQKDSFKFDFNSVALAAEKESDGYNFKRMLSLIDACEKVKHIEHMQFSQPGEVEKVDTQTLKSLAAALKQERKRLKHFIWQVRSHSRQSIPSKRMKAFKYYMRVMELNMQDIEEIVCTRDSGLVTKK